MKTKNTLKHRLGGIFLIIGMLVPVMTISQTTHVVDVLNNEFDPANLEVMAGDKVIWVNESGYHNVNGTTETYPSNPESFGNSEGSNWEYEYVFNTAGRYDYQCNPHVNLGMTGVINVLETPEITVNFAGMTPHVDQDLWLSVIDPVSGTEYARVHEVIEESFSIPITGLEANKAYQIDFYADFNENGYYDEPGTDHAWRIEIEDLTSDTTIDFTHNTDFTNIEWQHRLTVDFNGMTPHLGQFLQVLMYHVDDEAYVDTVTIESIPAADFEAYSYGIEPGATYHIDFYADHNQNGIYDAPPSDHAWRIVLEGVAGDTTVTFAHNTEFTDILNDQATNIHDQNMADGRLNVYPNPALNKIHIDLMEQAGTSSEIMMFDISGKLVFSKNITTKNEPITFDVSFLPEGLYNIQVISELHQPMSVILIKQ